MGRPVRTHTFNGRLYKIFVGALDGMCDTFKRERELVILADLDTRKGLITAVHESLHAENWAKKEADVERVGQEIGSFLWRLGYRKVE
ncbi:MAG TPA: hypothetical protein ENH85_15210 [Candidatus Scalindua sp.]|nr:hypothetical protein [Candidatus Scalindua sp.]